VPLLTPLLTPLLSLLLSPPAAAQAAETAFVVAPVVAVDLAHDRPAEDRTEAWTRLDARAEGGDADGRWRLAIRAEHAIRIGDASAGGDSEAAWWITAGESGWEGPIGPVRLRAGHLVERWGRLDVLPIADVLNGRDLRAGAFTLVGWQRLPTPLVRLQAGSTQARVELTLLPLGAADAASLWGTDHALVRQGQAADLAADAQTWSGDALTESSAQALAGALETALRDLDPQLRQGLSTGLAGSGRPRPLDESLDVGLRGEWDAERFDLALSAAWMRNRQPTPVADPTLVALLRDERLPGIADQEALLEAAARPLDTRWPRTAFGALEAGTTAGPFGLRAEAGAWSARSVPRRWLQATTSPALAAGAGVDWAPTAATLIAAEVRWDRLLDPPDDPFLVAPQDVALGLVARTALARERVGLLVGGQFSTAFGELILRPEATFRASDAVEVGVGAAVLTGGPDTPTSLRAALAHRGGPGSYWGDTDAVTASLKWIR
jgi:hypothetical protein